MNDDFLYRIRTEPPAHFVASLKERLDSAPRRRARALRFGLGALLFGTAFAMVVPGVRQSIGSLLAGNSSAPDEHVAQTAAPPSLLRVMPPDPVAADAEASNAGTDKSRLSVPQPGRPDARRTIRRPDTSAPPADVNQTQDNAHGETSLSDWSAAALAARGRDITQENLFTTASPTWPVVADETGARTAIALRRALFRVISQSLEPVEAITKKRRELDRDVVALSAYRLLQLSTMIDEAYAWDTRRWSELEGVNSLVWNRSGVFRKEIQEFSAASGALLDSAANGTPADIWRDAGRVTRSCARCHDGFTTRRDLPPH